MLLDHGTTVASSPLAVPRPSTALERSLHAWPGVRRRRPAWIRGYVTALLVSETAAAALTAGTVLASHRDAFRVGGPLLWASLALVGVWPALLVSGGAYSERVFGTGT